MSNDKLNIVSKELLNQENNLPVLSETFNAVVDLFNKKEYAQDINELSELILSDPFLSLKLLVKLQKRKKHNINHEIESIKKTIMMLGTKEVFDLVLSSSVAINHNGLKVSLKRANYASLIAKNFSMERHDISPDEVQLCTLLADLGELILWLFKPELTNSVRQSMLNGDYKRNKDAQLELCGFGFKDLSITLSEMWNLPEPLIDFLKSNEEIRTKLSKICVNISRHLNEDNGYLAIPDDILELNKTLDLSNEKIIQVLELEDLISKENLNYIINELKKKPKCKI